MYDIMLGHAYSSKSVEECAAIAETERSTLIRIKSMLEEVHLCHHFRCVIDENVAHHSSMGTMYCRTALRCQSCLLAAL